MKSYKENPVFIDGLIYLRISNGKVEAYGDKPSLLSAEKEQRTGRLFDYSVTPEEWDDAGNEARVVNGKLVLGMPDDVILARQEEVIRSERYLRLRQCDKMSPMRWNSLTEEQKQAWADYRQALLDVPQQEGFPWGGDPEKVPWPAKPE